MADDGSSAKFDRYAADYLRYHARSMRASGEPPEFFADHKMACLDRLLPGGPEGPVLDYGCGVGLLTSRLCRRHGEVHGFDPSAVSLASAAQAAPTAVLHHSPEDIPDRHFGLVLLSTVLHHVPVEQRQDLLHTVLRKVRPGTGWLVVFEHNPLNPLTVHSVSQCPYDDDAVLLGAWEVRRLMARAGFTNLRQEYVVFFPRLFARLRFLEPYLGWLPLGAQYVVLGRRPAA
jgi:2-polyprenyl-3-methyl-5-hydroxy-6-metoxy-1,4-benzoquinol methylase